ncbi:WbqC family protein [Phormidium sp. CLA17]|uniref:WbqC family protein n=1 Tax=Leptolyngbya sp. Cla-17 TaxID=2803751 RepID=UPI001490C656|nr:WbqC family protein [Leptolyngbya sp. Cla-17]MBM0740830.1 WbqC family protein [Leptolyngbya sp. Cla-17]
MKKLAVVQSNYIPWKGYFDLIAAVDEFILFDDVQYTRRDWRNRNQIKTPHGIQWLTVPVKVKGKYYQTIQETEINDTNWTENHWRAIAQNYCRTPYFEEVAALFEPLYQHQHTHLSVLNRKFIETVCDYLGVTTKISNSWDYTLVEGKTERLVDLCIQTNSTEYISGPTAKNYTDESLFAKCGVQITWFDYSNYPEYPQLWGEFTHNITILDLLFNCGQKAPAYMKYVRS